MFSKSPDPPPNKVFLLFLNPISMGTSGGTADVASVVSFPKFGFETMSGVFKIVGPTVSFLKGIRPKFRVHPVQTHPQTFHPIKNKKTAQSPSWLERRRVRLG